MIFFLLCTFTNSIAVFGQKNLQLENSNFDKDKWLTSSHYRYEIVKGENFPDLKTLKKKQIIRLLGKPNTKSNSELTYCFDISSKKNGNCEGSYLTISLSEKIPPKYRVTLVWVEKSIQND
jgi:hypothetical protein